MLSANSLGICWKPFHIYAYIFYIFTCIHWSVYIVMAASQLVHIVNGIPTKTFNSAILRKTEMQEDRQRKTSTRTWMRTAEIHKMQQKEELWSFMLENECQLLHTNSKTWSGRCHKLLDHSYSGKWCLFFRRDRPGERRLAESKQTLGFWSV